MVNAEGAICRIEGIRPLAAIGDYGVVTVRQRYEPAPNGGFQYQRVSGNRRGRSVCLLLLSAQTDNKIAVDGEDQI